MNPPSGNSPQADLATLATEAPALWLVPGPEKEAWKNEGNHIDYRELKASRPADLKITISGPRRLSNV